MCIPNELKSQHLAVLVGTNPLPVFVAIRLLRAEGGTVYLIHTAEVRDVARRVCQQAQLVEGKSGRLVEVNDARPADMLSKVRGIAAGKVEFGLNYTGGTKHMALHAYQALQKELATFDMQPRLSYLDARTLELRIEEGQRMQTYSVGLAVKPTLTQLLGLHGYTIKTISQAPLLPDSYCDLLTIDWKYLKQWCDRYLTGQKKEAQRGILLPRGGVYECLEPHWRNARTLGELADREQVDITVVTKWLHDHWLEHYTLWATQQVADECSIHVSGMNFEPAEREFEFDVVAMRGYQFFAVSCANKSDKGVLKLKLFEAFVRARQMGGEEARVGLVSQVVAAGRDSATALQRELEEEWDAKGRVRVFGAVDLPNLRAELKAWFLSGT